MATMTQSQLQSLVERIPAERLPIAYRMLAELVERGEPAELQRAFRRLPLPERNRILAERAEQMKDHYRDMADERAEWQAGDFVQ